MIDGVPARLIHAEQQLRSAVHLIDRGFWTEGVAAVEIALQDIEVLKQRLEVSAIPQARS